MEILKFQKKPLIVEAVRVSASNFNDVVGWCQGTIEQADGAEYIKVHVLNPMNDRQTRAFIGDWVLYASRGFKVYKDKAFTSSFDPLTGYELDKVVQASKPQPVA
jgi:hypothetical protein